MLSEFIFFTVFDGWFFLQFTPDLFLLQNKTLKKTSFQTKNHKLNESYYNDDFFKCQRIRSICIHDLFKFPEKKTHTKYSFKLYRNKGEVNR